MKNKIKINECFESLQGEGIYNGSPVLFIRCSGCTRKCFYCDTSYHNQGKFYSLSEIVKIINKSKSDIICWTGGEPLLWKEQIFQVISKTKNKYYHLETNGDLLESEDIIFFDYISCSPKDRKTILKIKKYYDNKFFKLDIKVVTDLDKVGKDLIKYATILMPLTTYNKKKDLEIRKKVWNYCVKHTPKYRYSPRLHVELFGKKRKV